MAVSVAPGARLCSSRARGLPSASASPALRRGAHPVCFDPTVYPDGRVCISILHAPGDDPMGYESSAERWSPVQSVEKILLSVVSMLAGKARGHTARRLPRSPVRFAPACGVRTGAVFCFLAEFFVPARPRVARLSLLGVSKMPSRCVYRVLTGTNRAPIRGHRAHVVGVYRGACCVADAGPWGVQLGAPSASL